MPDQDRDEREVMTDAEVEATLTKLLQDAENYVEHELSPDRAKATDYYFARPFGDEEKGRSQVVLPEVRDTIIALLPSLMRIFFGPERVAEYVARRQDAVAWAEQASVYIPEIVVKEDNPGFLHYYAWFKDALLKRLGVMKVWTDTGEVESLCAYNLLPAQAQELAADPDVTLTDVTHRKGAGGMKVVDLEYTRPVEPKTRFAPVPPEEFGYNRDARSLKDALIVYHKTQKTRSELIGMGVDEDALDEFADAALASTSLEAMARKPSGIQTTERTEGDKSTRLVTYVEAYPYMDVDGDGHAELRRICAIGDAYHIVENKPVSRRPFALLGMDPEPHTIQGLGLYDYTGDLQNIGSHVLRALLDSLAQSIFPRMGYVEGEVNPQDVLSQEMGAPIRMLKPGMLQPILIPFVGAEAMPVLEKLSDIKEQRTGIARAAAGLNADALQSSTKAAVAATVTAAQQRIELIARLFSETGVKDLYKLLLLEVIEHQPRERFVRLSGQYVTIDPRSWTADLDVSVNVALGNGTSDVKLGALLAISAKMEQLYATLGPNNPLFSMGQYRNVLGKIIELQGYKDTTQFLKAMPLEFDMPPSPPQQPPEQMVAEAEVMRAQADAQASGIRTQAEVDKRKAEIASGQAELQLKRMELEAEMAFRREQLAAEMAMKERELTMKFNAEMQGELMRAELKKNEMALAHAPSDTREIEVSHDPETGRVSKLRVKEVKE